MCNSSLTTNTKNSEIRSAEKERKRKKKNQHKHIDAPVRYIKNRLG